MKKDRVAISANTIRALLRAKYASPQWGLFEEVRSRTGFATSESERYIDALAIGLWPSTGLEVRGFEIKVSKSDWKKELQDPAKAEAFARFCDAWYIVTPAGLVDAMDLPPMWGLIEVDETGKRLREVVKAPKLTPQPLDRLFVAALVRSVHTDLERRVRKGVDEAYAPALKKAQEDAEKAAALKYRDSWDYRAVTETLLHLTGLSLYDVQDPAKLSEAAKTVGELLKQRDIMQRVDHRKMQLRSMLAHQEHLLAVLRDAVTDVLGLPPDAAQQTFSICAQCQSFPCRC